MIEKEVFPDIEHPEIMTLGQKELYETLLSVGHMADAVNMKAEWVKQNTEAVEQMRQYKAKVIFSLAKVLEKSICTNDPFPCKLCVSSARKQVEVVWPVLLYLAQFGRAHFEASTLLTPLGLACERMKDLANKSGPPTTNSHVREYPVQGPRHRPKELPVITAPKESTLKIVRPSREISRKYAL